MLVLLINSNKMSKITIYSEACNSVSGFQKMGEEFVRKLVINNRARSTHENYLRQMSKLALYYKRTPLDIDVNELEEYLYFLIQKDTDSRSSFKHLVYGLRKLYQLFDKEELNLALPIINKPNKLPVVLAKEDIKNLLNTLEHIRERIMFGLIYDTGLRINELSNLLIQDVDLNREQIHIRQSKNKKDRYVPMSSHCIRGIKKHMALNNPKDYLFERHGSKGMPISHTRIRTLFNEALVKAGIKKKASVHTLRHTYATHQLEAGQNIMVLKDLLGHANIQTTLIYLHIAQLDTVKKFGCLEYLFAK